MVAERVDEDASVPGDIIGVSRRKASAEGRVAAGTLISRADCDIVVSRGKEQISVIGAERRSRRHHEAHTRLRRSGGWPGPPGERGASQGATALIVVPRILDDHESRPALAALDGSGKSFPGRRRLSGSTRHSS